MPATEVYSHARRTQRCPDCRAPIERIRRRRIDRVRSLITPVWRFACSDPGCHWTATIRRASLRVRLFA